MRKLQQNIWLLFLLITISGLIFLGLISYARWQDTLDRVASNQSNVVSLLHNAIHSKYQQYELLLDLLGTQLVETDAYKDSEKSRAILSKLLAADDDIAGFGLASPSGELIVTSTNIAASAAPNLLLQKESRDSFKLALKSKRMVAGRNYYMNPLGSWVIPLRKTIWNSSEDKAIAVMTLGIHLHKLESQIGYKLDLGHHKRVVSVLRAEDNFMQLILSQNRDLTINYIDPVDSSLVKENLKRASQSAGMSTDAIKSRQDSVSFKLKAPGGHSVFVSMIYDNRYHHWILADTHFDHIWQEYFNSIYSLVLVTLGSLATLFFMFRLVARKEEESEQELIYQATHDPLTGVLNRYYLNKYTDDWFNQKNRRFSLLYIGLDYFKSVNDAFGHMVGDKLLITISQRLQNICPENSLIIRYGGDEFLLLIQEDSPRKIRFLASEILGTINIPCLVDEYKLEIEASIGITHFPHDAISKEQLLLNASMALREAKKLKNTISEFDEEIFSAYQRKITLEKLLSEALERDEVFLVYQPQLDSKSELVGVEALVRWQSDKLGFIPPDEFISIAEQTGQIVNLGRYIIQQALQEISKLQSEFETDFSLSINISVNQLTDHAFFNDLIKLVKKFDFSPKKLILEVTESLFIDDLANTNELLRKIKQEGIRISLDDFGTGYSSLSLLKSLPIDELKIDKSFIDDITCEPQARSMVDSIITIGKNLDLQLLAEGVEEEEQRALLLEYGCSLYQGYLFAKPMRINELANFITNKKAAR